MFEAIVFLTLGVAALAAVGHGIWLAVAAFFRLMAGGGRRRGEGPVRAWLCPRCGEMLQGELDAGPCAICAWELADPAPPIPAGRPAALRRIRGRVMRYVQLGLIPEEIGRGMVDVIPPDALMGTTPLSWQGAPGSAMSAIATPTDSPPIVIEKIADGLPEGLEEVEQAAEYPLASASPVDEVAALARAFREAREAEEAEPPPMPVMAPKRSWGEVLGAFLEEKNIRWGELVGGLLIVGCSLALVVGFWSSIAQRPWLQFGLFNGVTALLYGVGLHAERRWRLPSTAHGVLMIAAMLTPMNFLAVASMDRGPGGGAILGLAGGLALLLFGFLLTRAGRVLAPAMPWTLAAGVLAPSAAMLAMRRLGDPLAASAWPLLGIGLLPWAGQAAAVGRWLRGHRSDEPWGQGAAEGLLRLLGLSGFACLLATGLLMSQGDDALAVARRLAPLFPLAGAPTMAAGLALWRRAGSGGTLLRIAGPALAALGAAAALAGPVVGWPEVSAVVPAAVVGFALLTAVGVRYRVPAAHGVAGLALGVAVAFLPALIGGDLPWSGATAGQATHEALGTRAAGALVGLMVAYGVMAFLLLGVGRREEGRATALVAAVAGLYGVVVAAWAGYRLGAPGGPWVEWVAAIALAAGAVGFGKRPLRPGSAGAGEAALLGWIASGVTLAALILGMVVQGWVPAAAGPWAWATLTHSWLAAAVGLLVGRLARERENPWPALGQVAGRSATFAALATAALLAIRVPFDPPSALAWPLAGLSVALAATAWRRRSAALFGAHQAATAGAIAFGVAAWGSGRAWYAASPLPWLDSRMVQGIGLGLGLASLGWIAMRVAAARGASSPDGFAGRLSGLMNPAWPAVDRFVRWGVLGGLVGLAVYAALPGVAQELAPRSLAGRLAGGGPVTGRVVPPIAAFEIAGLPHAPARGPASWGVLGLVLAAMLAGMAERVRRVDLAGAIAAVLLAAPLAAAWWEPGVAVASALRWASMLALLAVSALIWARGPIGRLAGRPGLVGEGPGTDLSGLAAGAAIALALLPLAAMGVYTTAAAVSARGLDSDLQTIWIISGVAFAVAAALALLMGRLPEEGRFGSWAKGAGAMLGLLGTLPVVAVSGFVVASALGGDPVVGPDPGSFFGRIGMAGSYVPPVLLLAAVLIGYGLRDREPSYGLLAGLLLGLSAVMGYLMAGGVAARVLDGALAVRLAQIVAIVLAGYGAAWMAALGRWGRSSTRAEGAAGLLTRSAAILVGGSLALGMATLWFPGRPMPLHERLGDVVGQLAVVIVVGSMFMFGRVTGRPSLTSVAGGGVIALATLPGFAIAARTVGTYACLYAVEAGLLLAAGFGLAAAWAMRPRIGADGRRAVATWATIAWALGFLFAIRALTRAETDPAWSLWGLAAAGGLAVALSGWTGRGVYLGFGTAAINLMATVFWLVNPFDWAFAGSHADGYDLFSVNAMALALPQLALVPLARRWGRSDELAGPAGGARALDRLGRFAAWAGLVLLALMLLASIEAAGPITARPRAWVGWLGIGATAAALVARLGRTGPRGLLPLYLLGLVGAGWGVVSIHAPLDWSWRIGVVMLAVYALATSFLWSRRRMLDEVRSRLGWAEPTDDDGPGWLGWANLALVAVVLGIGARVVLFDPELGPRQFVANAMLAQGLALGLIARGPSAGRLRAGALVVGVLGLAAWLGAWIDPASPTALLDRLAVAFVALVAAAVGYGLGFSKLGDRSGAWTETARRLLPWMIGAAGLAGVVLIGEEVWIGRGGLPMSATAVGMVAGALLGGAVAAVAAAVIPGRDPLGLPEERRTLYVYGAELLLAALLIHLRLAMPWLFGGWMARYWPLIVLFVSFAGVGLAEVFRRQGRHVLAGPLERTGALLPALPLLAGLWTGPEPGGDVMFLVLAGGLYAALSALRSSTGFGALAALAFNGALWMVLGRTRGLGLAEHPQLWLIPPALCVLAGSYLVRDRLGRRQMAAVRQGSALVVYVSSTADIVLTGVAAAPWLPLVLGGLSILGILGGIWARVRGFLVLGFGFLGLSVFSMVWYAAVDLRMTWIWAASGIVAGVLILALFAVFEKKKQEIRHVVEEIKEWEG